VDVQADEVGRSLDEMDAYSDEVNVQADEVGRSLDEINAYPDGVNVQADEVRRSLAAVDVGFAAVAMSLVAVVPYPGEGSVFLAEVAMDLAALRGES